MVKADAKAGLADTATAEAAPARRRWLLFVHQLPTTPSNLRVRTWRRLQQLGAVPIKQAVYVLPDSPGAREDFEWLKVEVVGAGGQAAVFAADHVDAWSDDGLVEEFRRVRQEAYVELARQVEALLRRMGSTRPAAGTRAPSATRVAETLRQRLASIEAVDFFGSAGRDRVVHLLAQIEQRRVRAHAGRKVAASGAVDAAAYVNRLWLTRPRPGVDRMASAWLIRRFIDPGARFAFAADRSAVPEQGVPFDMFGVPFSHRGSGCTFETLCADFSLAEPAVIRLAAIVHDLDLKDGRFGAPEATAIGAVIDGLQLAYADDAALLDQGMILFDALYRAFGRSSAGTGPRRVARQQRPHATSRKTVRRRER